MKKILVRLIGGEQPKPPQQPSLPEPKLRSATSVGISDEEETPVLPSCETTLVSLTGARAIVIGSTTLRLCLPYKEGVTMVYDGGLPQWEGTRPRIYCVVCGARAQVIRAVRSQRGLGMDICLPEGITLSTRPGVVWNVYLHWSGASGIIHALTFELLVEKGRAR